jgi:hypothetical protein
MKKTDTKKSRATVPFRGGRQPLTAFQKSFCDNPRKVPPNWKKGKNALPVRKRTVQIQKL